MPGGKRLNDLCFFAIDTDGFMIVLPSGLNLSVGLKETSLKIPNKEKGGIIIIKNTDIKKRTYVRTNKSKMGKYQSI
jgi:hypothetical protein